MRCWVFYKEIPDSEYWFLNFYSVLFTFSRLLRERFPLSYAKMYKQVSASGKIDTPGNGIFTTIAINHPSQPPPYVHVDNNIGITGVFETC